MLKFAKMSNSLGAGELKSHFTYKQQASRTRAQWTPHTSRHVGGELEPEQRADVTRLLIGSTPAARLSNGPRLDSCKVGGAVHGISLI